MSEPLSIMEPLLPAENNSRELEDLVVDLLSKASRLAAQLHPMVEGAVGDLVRSMNCYYSNLLEGHDTHPYDIEKALAENFSDNPAKRNLQLEAKAHIEVQKMIDYHPVPDEFLSADYICHLHKEFCDRLPPEMLKVSNPETKAEFDMIPGQLRTSGVRVGQHIPVLAASLPDFLKRFEEGYSLSSLSKVRQIVAIPASHHRLLWIHPFYDGNGRVTRLLSHAFLKKTDVGSSLWSVSRGLARHSQAYKTLLMDADAPRHGDLDGRGSRTEKGLKSFCEFFLKICIDQVEFMDSLMQPAGLSKRLEKYCAEAIEAGVLPRGSFQLLREALLAGEFQRGKAEDILGYKERQSRKVLSSLCDLGLLVSDTPKGPVRLGFPVHVVEQCFPKLYPPTLDFTNAYNNMYLPPFFFK